MAVTHLGAEMILPGRRGKAPKKEIEHIRIREGESGGHIIEHHFTHPMHEPEHHAFGDGDGHKMAKHLDKHIGTKFAASMGVHQKGTQNPDDSEEHGESDGDEESGEY